MKNVVAAIGGGLGRRIECPRRGPSRTPAFSAPGPAGKITVQVSGECRGKLIYEAQDFTANTYANPNSQGHAYFTAHIPKANPIYGHFTATRQATNKIFRLKKQA